MGGRGEFPDEGSGVRRLTPGREYLGIHSGLEEGYTEKIDVAQRVFK